MSQRPAEKDIQRDSLEKGKRLYEEFVEDVDFGGDSTLPPPPTLTLEEEKRIYRKIDLRIMPILVLMYLCSFLDRGNIGASYHSRQAGHNHDR